jgi:YQGE family putative transporter
MFKFIRKEREAFNIFGADARRMLIINVIYHMAYPFIIIFGSAFVLRITGGNNALAIIYNWGFFLGLIAGYMLNGQLMKLGINIRPLFVAGMLLSVVPLAILMFEGREAGYGVILYGAVIGVGNGIYWSCRNFLTMLVTTDANRNFFSSVEQFIIIFLNALIPLLFGTFILGNNATDVSKLAAYRYTSIIVVGITLIAAWLILKSNFRNPVVKRFIYWKCGGIWKTQRLLSFFVGTVESGFMVLMTLLILNAAGDESVLGKIEFGTALVSVLSIYVLGRITAPQHRSRIMLAGATSLVIGGTVLACTITQKELLLGIVTISFIGVVVMKVCQVVADPMIHSSFRATYLSSIEWSSEIEGKDSYTFVMDNEYFMNGGRIFGGLLFLVLATLMTSGGLDNLRIAAGQGFYPLLDTLSSSAQRGGAGVLGALRYTFIALALLQLFSAYLIHRIGCLRSRSAVNVEPRAELLTTI